MSEHATYNTFAHRKAMFLAWKKLHPEFRAWADSPVLLTFTREKSGDPVTCTATCVCGATASGLVHAHTPDENCPVCNLQSTHDASCFAGPRP